MMQFVNLATMNNGVEYWVENLSTSSSIFYPGLFDSVFLALDTASLSQLRENRFLCVRLLEQFPSNPLQVVLQQCTGRSSASDRWAFFTDVLAEAASYLS